ncbi:MAG: hypothetical protein JO032_10950 [Alphaproteobacteria bacterium]|nr:hypothetical protein [Alphaproteobacteria bacterium]
MALPAWVAELGIAAQVFIAFAAVYGEKIRGRLAKPRLHIVLAQAEGEREPREIGGAVMMVGYHRLHIRNGMRYSVANEVQAFATKIERLQPTGDIQTEFSGAAPLSWQHQALYPSARNIGHTTIASVDLLYVTADEVHLASVEPKPESLGGGWRGEVHVWITVIARGLNAESMPVRLQIRRGGEPRRFSVSLVR